MLTVIVTARITECRDGVIDVLRHYGMVPHEIYCKPSQFDGSSGKFKSLKMKELLDRYPSIKSVQIFEDDDHCLNKYTNATSELCEHDFEIFDAKIMHPFYPLSKCPVERSLQARGFNVIDSSIKRKQTKQLILKLGRYVVYMQL